jgi:hypothetical protein
VEMQDIEDGHHAKAHRRQETVARSVCVFAPLREISQVRHLPFVISTAAQASASALLFFCGEKSGCNRLRVTVGAPRDSQAARTEA